ncbi:hypothetical protein M404DRAFT_30992 [Pisolithus tinctorius Marx 270]|uniref:Integrase catalytic domain-containing protein n=1 Tax=Pisolithus tinctorius Marx 270 TaxID=870435 RepID=A0A0C3NUG9_PISTI|nr:hypothetical protein M404DRAFT_30992 [Pisolithus tinctorius Marx 270]
MREPIKGAPGVYAISTDLYERIKNNTSKDSTGPEPSNNITIAEDRTKRFRTTRLYIPPEDRHHCMRSYHDHESAGHPGQKAMFARMRKEVWWEGMGTDIKKYVAGCPSCQTTKVVTHPLTPPVVPHETPKTPFPFQQVSMDLITDLPMSGEQKYDSILMVVDQGLTKAALFIPCHKNIDSVGIARLFHQFIYSRFGLPESVISDQGPQFASSFTKELYKAIGVKTKLSTGYHPQTNGESERVNQEVEGYLCLYCSEFPNSWAGKLPSAEFTHNSRVHSVHKMTPFSLILGYDPSPYPEKRLTPVPSIDKRLERLTSSQDVATLAHQKAQELMRSCSKGSYEPPKVGDQVLLDTGHLRIKNQCDKIAPRRLGPFKVTQVMSPVAFRLDLPPTWKVHPVFHASRVLPYVENEVYGTAPAAPLPKLVDDEIEWEVEAILNHKTDGHRGQRRYLVKWKGFPHSSNTWEPEEHIKDHAVEALDQLNGLSSLPDGDNLLIPPIACYRHSPPPTSSSGFPESDTSSLVSQWEQGFSVRRVPVPKARVPLEGDSNQQGKGKGKEKSRNDANYRTAAPTSANAPITPNVRPADPVLSRSAALDLLASVTLARDDEPRLPISASDYLDVTWTLDVFNKGDNIDRCTPEQVEYFGVLSEIYRVADIIGQATNRIRVRQLSGTAPLAKVIMTSMLKKGYADVLEAVTGGAYHHLRDRQVREFLAPTASRLLEQIKPKEPPVIPEMKPDVNKEVRWDPPLEFIDNATVFKEAAKRLGMGRSESGWCNLLTDASWAGLDKEYHNAVHSTSPIPPAPFVPISVDQLRFYLGGHAKVPEGHPLYKYACYQCRYLGHWSCRNGQGSRWTQASKEPPSPSPPLPVATHTRSRRPLHNLSTNAHASSSRV